MPEVMHPDEKATDRQVGYIMSLALKAHIRLSDFQMMFGVENPAELTRIEASTVIDQLKARHKDGMPTFGVEASWEGAVVSAPPKTPTVPKVPEMTDHKKSALPPPAPGSARWGKRSPLPTTAPKTPGLYCKNTGSGYEWYRVRISSSGNLYSEFWDTGLKKWEYEGQAAMRRDKDPLKESDHCFKSGYDLFMSTFGVCPCLKHHKSNEHCRLSMTTESK